MASVDLNKALPPQPPVTIENSNQSISCRTHTPSLSYSNESKIQRATTSTASSALSRASSKVKFHRITNELVHAQMAGSRDPSPLREMDSDKFLIGSKYDPLASPTTSDRPLTFSSFNKANPFTDYYEDFIPPIPVPRSPDFYLPDPIKIPRGPGIPLSKSEGQLCSPKPLQIRRKVSRGHGEQPDETSGAISTHLGGVNTYDDPMPRGRVPSRDVHRVAESSPISKGKDKFHQTESRKRSRSPVKRLLGLGKSQSMKEIPQETEARAENEKKASLKVWGDRLRHGFMTTTDSKANINSSPHTENSRKSHSRSRSRPSTSTFPISIKSPEQAKMIAELELMIITCANKFLLRQNAEGLLSADSVAKILNQWKQKNRPQVINFQFDQATQRDLILYNVRTIDFHGECGTNPLVLNATMYAWKVMAKEMSVRTYCTPDSVMRKHFHDAHRVLEMLGAGLNTFLGLQELQVCALKEMNDGHKKRMERQVRKEREMKIEAATTAATVSGAGNTGVGTATSSSRKFTPPTPCTSFMSAPMSSYMDEEILFEDPYEG